MTWDAFSDADVLSNVDHKQAFGMAAQQVINEAGTVDPGLSHGWLYTSACRDIMIEIAEHYNLGWGNAWSPVGMRRQEVKQRAEAMDFDKFKDRYADKLWALLSVKLFVITCAELNLRINFSSDEK